jgi:uncharacterized protein (DUF1800 family)
MDFDQAVASVRFGYGLGPRHGAPGPAGARVARLAEPDAMAARHPIPGFASLAPAGAELRRISEIRRKGGTEAEAAEAAHREILTEGHRTANRMLMATLARTLDDPDPLRERLVRFWADHFTTEGKAPPLTWAAATHAEDAIRPHVAGRFADMLAAAVLHPMMLLYLDQDASVGPGSPVALERPGRGLNENLARELLELHTLGVGGGYDQRDVREMAELLTGLTANVQKGMGFAPRRAEPGAETVLGVRYGDEAGLDTIRRLLDDLAAHPDTARHIGRKLAVHFVADDPDPGLAAALAETFAATGGQLLPVYEVLLSHPAAQTPRLAKAKQPFDFMASTLRALGVEGAMLTALPPEAQQKWFRGHLTAMGQRWGDPAGPDGWPEDVAHWITPQGMAARIAWALAIGRVEAIPLPDPRDFVETALGPLAGERLRFAAGAAETRAEGVAVVLSAPEFQRR